MSLTTAFHQSAQQHAAKTALCWGDAEYTYADLWNATAEVRDRLVSDYDIRAGDRVGLWLQNCPQFIPCYFGILYAGAAVVPINSFLKPAEISYILEDAGIDVLITDRQLSADLGQLQTARPGLKLLWIEEVPMLRGSNKLKESAPIPQQADELAVLIYTSGTTGRSKGAMLSHASLLHNVESSRITLQFVPQDRFAVILPLFHSYMMTLGMLLPLLNGGSTLLIKSVHPVRNVLTEVLNRKATVLAAIPQFFRSFVGVVGGAKLPLRLCISGAAPLPVQILNEFENHFKIPLIEGYGLSEACPEVSKNPLDGRRKPGSIGLPIANVEMSIQDDAGEFLGAKQVGEICVRGGNVMMGYWRNPDETTRVMRNGWLLTGDVGYRDEDGFYFITDRKKDVLLVNGCNVYPREIEEVLYQCQGVREAAVIGMPDDRRGEQPVAFVSLDKGVALDEVSVRRYLKERLADYKVPKKFVVLPMLPRNATGKILKRSLKEIPLQA